MTAKQKVSILVLSMGICLLPTSAKAGGDPAVVRPPAPAHRFLDGKNIGVLSLSSLMMAADLITTQRALQVPGTHEANPLMKNQAAAISLKVGALGVGMVVAYGLHRSGHHKAERIVPLVFGIPSAIAAAHNATIR